ncbi:MAG TPA: malate synthase A [Thermoanaerobaculia bacterium]|nr:malate synthase A [Thermoanaerobaculia bacterium]HQR66193.1 malate synthase A [Thermoanaerobaculia bacterium]
MSTTRASARLPFTDSSRALVLSGPPVATAGRVLTPEALDLVVKLQRAFGGRREELLERRRSVQARLHAGGLPDFLPETRSIRESDWTVAPIPKDLLDRRVEITGPVDRKMIINALNSGASVFMADFEDANSPTWENVVDGQANLTDAIDGTISFASPEGKTYRLNETTATLMVRPRGWHLLEKHATLDGKPVSGSLWDFALFFFHNAKKLVAKGSGPYFYLPKMESHLEARLWNDVFVMAQEHVGLPQGTIRGTVLIETILAGFEMDEILWELRDHSAGLNCGRWDYIFSFIKKFSRNPDRVLPDRGLITMEKAFLKAYVALLIRTCHRRNVHAMGGMAAQIPIKSDPEANRVAMEKVEADKWREVKAGHDGTWVAHPGLVPVAKKIFDDGMPQANQISRRRDDVVVTAADLLSVPTGPITEKGLRQNVNVGILYLEAWLRGSGCVPLYNLMEDAATSEISRTQVWQWIHHRAALEDGRKITLPLYEAIRDEELASIRKRIGEEAWAAGRFALAAKLFDEMVSAPELPDFLTLPAYDALIALETGG